MRGLMRGMANLSQGNQELLVNRDKVRRPPGKLGVSKSMECDIFPSVLWHCCLGDRKGIRPVKKLPVVLLVVMIWLELCTTYSSSCHHHFHHPLLQWTPANPRSPGKWLLKWRERFTNIALKCDDASFYKLQSKVGIQEVRCVSEMIHACGC